MPDADLLQRHLQILLEIDRIRDVEPVEAAHRRHVVIVELVVHRVVAVRVIRVSHEERRIRLLDRPAVLLVRERVGAAEVVLRPGPADRRVLRVPVDVELHLALAPPVALERLQCKVSSDISAAPFHAVEDDVVLPLRRDRLPAPLRVEVLRVLRQRVIQVVVDLVEDLRHRVPVLVLDRDLRPGPKRHREVAVEPAHRKHQDRHRSHFALLAEAAAEEVPERHLDRRRLLPVPVHAQHQVAEDEAVRVRRLRKQREPDVRDHAAALDVSQHDGVAGLDVSEARAALAALPEHARGHAAPALFSRRILRVDRPASPVSEIRHSKQHSVHGHSLFSRVPLMYLPSRSDSKTGPRR